MRYLFAIPVIAVTLAGCATQELNAGLKGLMGQPISAAVDRLGFPDGKRHMMGETIYIWSTNYSSVMAVPQYTTTTGAVGNVPYYSTTSSIGLMRTTADCTVELAVNSEKIITWYKWQGNQYGCRQYANGFQ